MVSKVEWRACTSKKRYSDARYALTVAAWQIRHNYAPPLRAYECPFCWGWHLTKKHNGQTHPRSHEGEKGILETLARTLLSSEMPSPQDIQLFRFGGSTEVQMRIEEMVGRLVPNVTQGSKPLLLLRHSLSAPSYGHHVPRGKIRAFDNTVLFQSEEEEIKMSEPKSLEQQLALNTSALHLNTIAINTLIAQMGGQPVNTTAGTGAAASAPVAANVATPAAPTPPGRQTARPQTQSGAPPATAAPAGAPRPPRAAGPKAGAVPAATPPANPAAGQVRPARQAATPPASAVPTPPAAPGRPARAKPAAPAAAPPVDPTFQRLADGVKELYNVQGEEVTKEFLGHYNVEKASDIPQDLWAEAADHVAEWNAAAAEPAAPDMGAAEDSMV